MRKHDRKKVTEYMKYEHVKLIELKNREINVNIDVKMNSIKEHEF